MKKIKPEKDDINNVSKKLQYHVYDYPSCNKVFVERIKDLNIELEDILKTDSSKSNIIIVETTYVDTKESLDKIEEEYLKNGYEGQMIRILLSMYEFKRSKNLLKRKRFKEQEFEIIGVEEGVGNKTGWAATMNFKTSDGQDFSSNVKGPEIYLRELWTQNASLIGKKATVRYFNLTPAGIPRFPYVVAIRDYE